MKTLKRVVNGTSAAVLTLSSLMSMGFTSVAHAAAQTCTWTGATDLKFSTASNWSGCNNTAPQAGDIIAFTTVPNANKSLNNDLSVALGGVRVSYGVLNQYDYTINQLSLADGATIADNMQSTCGTYPINLTVNSVSSTGSVIDTTGIVGSASTIAVGGNLTLAYGYLAGSTGSHVDGNIIIGSPVSTLASGCDGGGAGGGGQQSGAAITGVTIHGLIVQNGSSVAIADASYPITLGGGTGSDAPELQFYGNTDSDYNYVATTYNVSGPITLLSDADFYINESTTVNVTGSISGSGFSITRDPYSDASGILNIQPSSNTSSTATGKITNPAVTTNLTDSQPTGYATVKDNETTTLDGERQDVYVSSGGTLKGTGKTKYLTVGSGGVVAPGHSPGKLTVSNTLFLNGGSKYQAELKDTTDGDFDQLIVGSAADTTGNDVELGDTPTSLATLDVQLYSGFKIKAGDQFMIINNLSGTPVQYTFNGLPEGATFKVGNGVFKISYVGGDGNDVVLTAVTAPTAPDTGFALMSSHPGATFGITAVAAGFIFAVAKSNKRKPAAVRARTTGKRRK